MLSQIENYRIVREIGSGGFAKVYLAEDQQLRREVAIKVLHANLAGETDYRRFFEREAQLVASLEHLAVVPIYDYGEINGQLFLVMRFMRGGTLADRLEARQSPLTLREVINLYDRLAPTLDAIHQRGVIHRDLKPSNILYDDLETPYIADFGIARIQQTTSRLTQTGLSFGTLQYSSPEQVTGEGTLDHRSDIYTLGIILYQLLAGDYPYWSDTPLGWVHKHAEAPIPNVRDANDKLPEGVQAVLEGMMAKSPAERYGSVGAAVADLKRAEAGQPIEFKSGGSKAAPALTVPLQRPVKEAVPPPPSAAGGRRRTGAVLGGVAMILVVGALAFLAWQNRHLAGVFAGGGPRATVGATEVVVVADASPTTAATESPATDGSDAVPSPTAGIPAPTPQAGEPTVPVIVPTEPPTEEPTPTSTPPATETATATPAWTATAEVPNDAVATAQAAAALALLPPEVAEREAFIIPYAGAAPVLDGDLEEWNLDSFQSVQYALFRPENISGSLDLSATCAGSWTLDVLFIACRVNDDRLAQVSTGASIFQGDGLELLFDTELLQDLPVTELDQDDTQIGVVPGGAFGRATEVYRWFPRSLEGPLHTVSVESDRSFTGYSVEIGIPWGDLSISPRAKDFYGFGLSINDNDSAGTAAQESQISLFDAQRLSNPTTWGLLVLAGEP